MLARAHDATLLAARSMLAVALLPTGIARALNVSGFALTLAGSGVPFPNAVATCAVVAQVFGPLALIIGILPRATGILLAVFAVATAFVLHAFWQFTGPAFVAERTLMLADLGLAGGYLLYAVTGPGAWSWQAWRAGGTPSRAKNGARTPGKAAGKSGGPRRTAQPRAA